MPGGCAGAVASHSKGFAASSGALPDSTVRADCAAGSSSTGPESIPDDNTLSSSSRMNSRGSAGSTGCGIATSSRRGDESSSRPHLCSESSSLVSGECSGSGSTSTSGGSFRQKTGSPRLASRELVKTCSSSNGSITLAPDAADRAGGSNSWPKAMGRSPSPKVTRPGAAEVTSGVGSSGSGEEGL